MRSHQQTSRPTDSESITEETPQGPMPKFGTPALELSTFTNRALSTYRVHWVGKWTVRGTECRGTSLIRNSDPLGPYSRTIPTALRWSWWGGAVSYERGTPVPQGATQFQSQVDTGTRAATYHFVPDPSTFHESGLKLIRKRSSSEPPFQVLKSIPGTRFKNPRSHDTAKLT